MSKHNSWLATQLPLWVSDQIISQQQAEQLQSLYPVRDSIHLGRLLLTAIGAIMMGLGVILLFAYNWDDMSKYLKLSVIFGSMLITHFAAFALIQRNKVLSEGLFIVGTMLMGSAIFLVGQIYHLDSHYLNAFLLWSAGALALAWALPSISQAYIATFLVGTWHINEVVDFNYANHAAFPLILITLLPLVWRLNAPGLARFVSIALMGSLALSTLEEAEGLTGIILLMFATGLLALNQIIKQQGNMQYTNITSEMSKPAGVTVIIILFSLTFSDLIDDILDFNFEYPLATSYFWATLLFSQLTVVWLIIKRQLNRLVILAELSILLSLLPALNNTPLNFSVLVDFEFYLPLIFNVILMIFSIWLMIDGARLANRHYMVSGCLIFSLLAMVRYTDLFDSLITRAVIFLIVGLILFAMGNVYQRNKKAARS